MHKRVIIGLLAVVVIGAVVYFVSQPKEGTVEWHLREVKQAEREILGNTWKQHLAKRWHKLRGTTYPAYVDMTDPKNPQTRSDMHEQALIDLGYWEKRQFNLTNVSAGEVAKILTASSVLSGDKLSQVWLLAPLTSNLWVRARRVDMPTVAELIREADVPESAKAN